MNNIKHNMLEGIKHQIECNCVLPQFSKRNPPIFHKFNVFSIIESNGNVRPSYAKCNNCDAIHKVIEINTSKQLPKENSRLLPSLDEIKESIPEKTRKIIESYTLDLPTWQELEFIYENEKWGKSIILFKEEDDGKTVGKYIVILGKTLFKIEKFVLNDEDK